jgi:alkanesulfonate monooxygenase SsuD/methylene tetrahydromethanopterin reductase-like flavin-dependent oxidoreductase (luciferase family)
MIVQIGMFYQIQVPRPWKATSEAERYRDMLEQVSYADEIGFSSVWLAEHQFRFEWSHSSAPDVSLGAISQITKNLRLGIAVVVPPVHHPLHIAARIATLDILSNGRVDMGIGRSAYPYQMDAFGRELKDATGIVDETLEIIPRAWTEEEITYDGDYFKIPPRHVLPKPVQTPHPPIWQGCSRDESFQKAGQLGLGCIAQGGPERIAQPIRTYREAIKQATPVSKVVCDRVIASAEVFCHEDRKQAFKRGAALIDWYRHQRIQRDNTVWQGKDVDDVPEDYRWHYDRSALSRSQQDDTPSIELLERGDYCIGDPDDCIRFLQQYEAVGVDEMIPLFQIGPITNQEVMKTLELFGKYVIPHFSKA